MIVLIIAAAFWLGFSAGQYADCPPPAPVVVANE